ncbi:DUF6753 family protein [Nostoc sp. MG11]|uniref:DUF6753 family protein n=1 Tax=Nostoc sp. MG11 TaxID=2721166 RepID=UPI00186679D6|nr:DUF6753 family protein [Nostoc sp. MG11]
MQALVATTKLGISPDDPLFETMAVMGDFLEELGEKTKNTFSTWEDISKKHEISVAEAIKKTLAKEVHQIKTKTIALPIEPPQVGKFRFGFYPITFMLGGFMAVGALLGSLVTSNVIKENSAVTSTDLQLLEWAKSPEGKLSKQVITSNKAAIKNCYQEGETTCSITIRAKK